MTARAGFVVVRLVVRLVERLIFRIFLGGKMLNLKSCLLKYSDIEKVFVVDYLKQVVFVNY